MILCLSLPRQQNRLEEWLADTNFRLFPGGKPDLVADADAASPAEADGRRQTLGIPISMTQNCLFDDAQQPQQHQQGGFLPDGSSRESEDSMSPSSSTPCDDKVDEATLSPPAGKWKVVDGRWQVVAVAVAPPRASSSHGDQGGMPPAPPMTPREGRRKAAAAAAAAVVAPRTPSQTISPADSVDGLVTIGGGCDDAGAPPSPEGHPGGGSGASQMMKGPQGTFAHAAAAFGGGRASAYPATADDLGYSDCCGPAAAEDDADEEDDAGGPEEALFGCRSSRRRAYGSVSLPMPPPDLLSLPMPPPDLLSLPMPPPDLLSV